MTSNKVASCAVIADGYQLSPQQKRLWTLKQNYPSFPVRAQCRVVIEGELDNEKLNRAIAYVIEKHEILRTSFQHLHGMLFPLQTIDEPGPPVWLTEQNKQDIPQSPTAFFS